MAPWLIGIVPYGLVIGVAAARAGMPALAGWLTGPLIFSGGAQLAVIDLVHAGAAWLVILATTLAINLRLVLYSAAIAPHWRGAPWWWQAAGAYLLVDPTLAVGVAGYEQAPDRRQGHLHYLGGALLLWIAWLAAIGVGVTAGATLPAGLHLELVVPLFLAGEAVHRMSDGASTAAGAIAVVTAMAATSVPLRLGPALAIGAGISAALVFDRRSR
jgi:predicted branched-subunit amino acid permease